MIDKLIIIIIIIMNNCNFIIITFLSAHKLFLFSIIVIFLINLYIYIITIQIIVIDFTKIFPVQLVIHISKLQQV